MYLPTSVKIALMSSNPNKDKLYPIVLRFIQNRKPRNIYLRKYIPLESWLNEGMEYVKEKGEHSIPNAKHLNFFLNAFLQKAVDIVLRAEREGVSLTFEQFKKLLVANKNQSFYDFCEKELERRLKSGKFSKETVKSNGFKLKKMKYFRKTLLFNDLTPELLSDYENYLRVERGNGVNTIFAAMKFIRTMLNEAIRQKLTTIYPFDTYKLVYKKDTRDRLYNLEIELLQELYNNKTLTFHLQRVLKHFLFVCYTGLSWGDLKSLNYHDIKELNGVFVINKKRNKTETKFTVPLLEEAKAMIDLTKKEGLVFPDLGTNQRANLYIKKVIEITSIKKHVTFHVGRHSFGTVSLNKGIPREVVQKMLGHAKSEMTDIYSKVLDSYIITEMEKWQKTTTRSDFKKSASPETLDQYKKVRTTLVANRIVNGLSESDLAKKIGVTEQDYKDMEMGNKEFGFVSMIEISRVLEVDLKNFL